LFLFYWCDIREGVIMSIVKDGNKVKISFEAKLETGEIIFTKRKKIF